MAWRWQECIYPDRLFVATVAGRRRQDGLDDGREDGSQDSGQIVPDRGEAGNSPGTACRTDTDVDEILSVAGSGLEPRTTAFSR